jgi:predicted nucleic acid-binding protein
MKKTSFVLDTNIWISAIITNSETKLEQFIFEYILLIEKVCLNKNSPKHYNMAPDKDDNYLYDVCIDTKSILVTGDKLLLNYISNPPVVTISRNAFFDMF